MMPNSLVISDKKYIKKVLHRQTNKTTITYTFSRNKPKRQASSSATKFPYTAKDLLPLRHALLPRCRNYVPIPSHDAATLHEATTTRACLTLHCRSSRLIGLHSYYAHWEVPGSYLEPYTGILR